MHAKYLMHAQQTPRLVQQPMVAAVAYWLLTFLTSCQVYLQPCPSLQVGPQTVSVRAYLRCNRAA